MKSVRQVAVIAHRGASGYLPEHTAEAKAMAHAMGADYLEQDVVLTKDDVPVVMHDIHLDTISDVATRFPDRKRADGRYYAIDFTLEEVQQLNASERFHHKTGKAVYPNRFPVHQGRFQIPSLADELELIQGLNQSTGRAVGIYPELKQPTFHHREGKDLAQSVLAVLARYGYRDASANCWVQCFEATELRRVHSELKSPLKLVQLLGDQDWMSDSSLAKERSERLVEIAAYAQGIGPAVNSVFRKDPMGGLPIPTELTAQAHQQGLVVHPWTYRSDAIPKLFDSFADLHRATVLAGVDGIFSDHPDQSVELLTLLTSAQHAPQ